VDQSTTGPGATVTAGKPQDRKVGLWIAAALVVGNMIGSGVFLLPASLAPFGGVSILGWLFTSAGAMAVALLLAGLARRIPRAGGPYAYTREGLGGLPAFLVAWGYWISIWSGNAAISVAFVGYSATFFPALAQDPALGAGAALGTIWLLTGVNVLGVREAGILQLWTTILKLLPLAALGTLGLLYLNPQHFVPFNASGGSSFGAVTATATLTLWAFVGLESATIPADSVRDPGRTIPRATLLGTGLAALVYISATVGVMGILPASELAGSTAPFADAAARIWGGRAGSIIAVGAAISAFGALNGWILLQGQMPMAAARDGLLPGVFGRVSRRGVPVAGLVVSSVLVTFLIALNYTDSLVEQFTFIILLATLSTLIPYIFSSLSELVMLARDRPRRRGEGVGRRTALAVVALLYSLWAVMGSGRDTVFWGLLLLLAGVPVYAWQVRKRGANGVDGLNFDVGDG
jgi:basic amino acid/polyamine antiporter, APA family